MREPNSIDEDSFIRHENNYYNHIVSEEYLRYINQPLNEGQPCLTINKDEDEENVPEQNTPFQIEAVGNISQNDRNKKNDIPLFAIDEDSLIRHESDDCDHIVNEEYLRYINQPLNEGQPCLTINKDEDGENVPEQNTPFQIEAVGNISQNDRNKKNDFPFLASSYQNKIQEEKCSESSKNTRALDIKLGTKRAKPDENISEKISKNNKYCNCGRKPYKSKEEGAHNRFSEDNMARKIKSFFLSLIITILNEYLKDTTIQFLKLDYKINKDLNVKFNKALFGKKLKDIFIEFAISSKYNTQKENNNKNLIEKIYAEKKEVAAISLLERTYLDLFENMFITDYLETFLNDATKKGKRKESEKNNDIIYKEKIKKLCMNFRKWFEDKTPRNRVKKN